MDVFVFARSAIVNFMTWVSWGAMVITWVLQVLRLTRILIEYGNFWNTLNWRLQTTHLGFSAAVNIYVGIWHDNYTAVSVRQSYLTITATDLLLSLYYQKKMADNSRQETYQHFFFVCVPWSENWSPWQKHSKNNQRQRSFVLFAEVVEYPIHIVLAP